MVKLKGATGIHAKRWYDILVLFAPGEMHSGTKRRSRLWLIAMHSGKKVMNLRIRTPFIYSS